MTATHIEQAQAWNEAFSAYLVELDAVQTELLDVLSTQRERMAKRDLTGWQALQTREAELSQRLESCQAQRQKLLASARQQGLVADNLEELAEQAPPRERAALGKQVKNAAWRARLLQHQSLTNWVVAQRNVLHLAQLIEIIATGGKLQPTYGKSDTALARGALVDQEA